MSVNAMQVAFNARSLMSPLTGVGQYAHHLLHALIKKQLDFDLFYAKRWDRQILHSQGRTPSRVRRLIRDWVPASYNISRLIQNYYFQKGVRSRHHDLYHEPNFLVFDFDGPVVLTVHDLSWIRHPESHPRARVRMMNTLFERSLNRASEVITDSQFVKDELVAVFGYPAQKINPIPLGVSPNFSPMSRGQTLGALSGLDLQHGSYFLSVSTLEPRKNLITVVEAFLLLPKHVRLKFPLVLVGMSGWLNTPLMDKISKHLNSGEIRLPGYLSQEDLYQVMAGATTLIYPSLYEGFGLPPLEAMASGVPVIASNTSSIPEVVGDAGILLDPDDVRGFSEAMKAMLEADKVRKKFSARALERSRLFTWENCADLTLDVYKKAVRN